MKFFEGLFKRPWVYLVSLILLVIIVMLLHQVNNYKSVTPGVWLQTIGTVLGAFLGARYAGKYAIESVKTQNELEQKRINEVEKRNAETTAYKVVSCFDSIISMYNDFESRVNKKELSTHMLERQKNILSSTYSDLDKIDVGVFNKGLFSKIHEEKIDFKNRLFDFEIMLEECYDNLDGKDLIRGYDISYLFYKNVEETSSGFDRNFQNVMSAKKRLEKLEKEMCTNFSIKVYDQGGI